MSRKIYLCLLLTTLAIQQGYKTKTQLQRLAEGNVVQNTPVPKKTNKKKDKSKNNEKTKAPQNTGQQKLEITEKGEQKTLLEFGSVYHPIIIIKSKKNTIHFFNIRQCQIFRPKQFFQPTDIYIQTKHMKNKLNSINQIKHHFY